MVPLVTLVAFTLMGIEGIANEIGEFVQSRQSLLWLLTIFLSSEMPFGKKAADLPLGKSKRIVGGGVI